MRDFTLDILDQTISLMPERIAFWQEARTLIVADLHWGKSETLQAIGIPLPSKALSHDLQVLRNAVERTQAQRVIVLGDLVHAKAGLTSSVVREVTLWRQSLEKLDLVLVRGNHDRLISLPTEWDVTLYDRDLQEGPFCFLHGHDFSGHSRESSSSFTWEGHVHPSIRLSLGKDTLKLPCFARKEGSMLIPAFGTTTGTFEIKAEAGVQIYVVGDEFVCPLE